MPMNTFHMKMKVLNQVTCAMHPEYEIPWYYEDYCQEFYTKLEERFPPVWVLNNIIIFITIIYTTYFWVYSQEKILIYLALDSFMSILPFCQLLGVILIVFWKMSTVHYGTIWIMNLLSTKKTSCLFQQFTQEKKNPRFEKIKD